MIRKQQECSPSTPPHEMISDDEQRQRTSQPLGSAVTYDPRIGTDDENAIPPDGGYGWVCTACTFTINCFSWGMVSTYGVYLAYYLSSSTFPESRTLDYAFVGGLSFGSATLVSPVVTVVVRQFGIKAAMFPGALMVGAGFIAASFATRIWHLYLTQGALLGIGVGFLYVPGINILSQWFSTKRTLANGISAAGSGIGGLAFSFATGAMIDHLSLAWSLRITGLVAFFCNFTAAVFVRDRNALVQPKQRPFDLDLLFRKEVALLLAWVFLSMLGYITLLYSMSDFALSVGLSRNQATQVTAFLNMGTAIIRPFIGVASDRFGRFEVSAGLTLLCGMLSLAVWIPATSFGLIVFFAVISGGILGVFWMTIGPLCVEVAGLKELPSLLSLSWLTTVIPVTFSEVIALYLRQPTRARPYLYAQLYCGLCYVRASGCLWYAKKMCETKRRRT